MHGYICCVCIREVTNRDEEGDIPNRKPSVVKFDPATSKCNLRLVVFKKYMYIHVVIVDKLLCPMIFMLCKG